MARLVIVEHIDDIDGTPIAARRGETIAFSVNGVDYEIDLSATNAREFHKKLARYIDRATKVGGRKSRSAGALTSRGGTTRKPVRRDGDNVRAVREWAQDQGYDIGVRGRIPAAIKEAYRAAQ
ncbi:histone-like nucleoid-structuring protein Lsr2 [Rhodococcus wratislaviensis]|uniref:histone-like nucleoid-structuring protein Lsr2 n=1 Tax=Rhodococcus wratislaviensis TaxID=44752 RepID=UPI003655D07E